jgi:hypothetical protein
VGCSRDCIVRVQVEMKKGWWRPRGTSKAKAEEGRGGEMSDV